MHPGTGDVWSALSLSSDYDACLVFVFSMLGRGLLGIVYGRSFGRDTFRAVVIGDIFLIDFLAL